VLQENSISYSDTTKFWRETILGLDSEDVLSLPKDGVLDEENQTVLLVLSNEQFSSVRQITGRMCVPKTLYIVGLLILSISQSDIFIEFFTSSSTVRRQVESSRIESSCRSNFVTFCCPFDFYTGNFLSISILWAQSGKAAVVFSWEYDK
jgi:hypothetical protein